MTSKNIATGELPPRSILIVDDDAVIRRYLEAVLANVGCRLVFAGDGLEAMARVEADPPDLVLLDILMPGLDGFEVCRRIKDNPGTRHIPVIHLTSLGEEAKERSFEAGADDFLNKPLHIVELMSRVRAHLLIQSLQAELKASQGEQRGWRWEAQPRARILVAVADVDLREWVVDKLRSLGHDVLWADTLRSCLDQMRQGLPETLILGHQLVDGSGTEFLANLRNFAKSRDLPVLLLCTREAMDAKQVGPEAGPTDFLTVPTDDAALRIRVEMLLREGRLLRGHSADRVGFDKDLLVDPATGAYSEAFLEVHLSLAQGWLAQSRAAMALLGAGCYRPMGDWLETRGQVARCARFLSAALKPGEALCRVADRTFVLILPGLDAQELERRMEALREAGFEGALAGVQVTSGVPPGILLRNLALALRKDQVPGGGAP